MVINSNLKQLEILILVFALAIVLFSCHKNKNEVSYDQRSLNIEVSGLLDTAFNSFLDGEYLESRRLFDKLDSLIVYSDDTTLLILSNLEETHLLNHEGKYEESLDNNHKASVLAQLTGDSVSLGNAYYNTASISYIIENYDKADEYNLKAQDIFKDLKKTTRLTHCYVLYAIICERRNNDFPKAKKYLKKAMSIYEKEGNKGNLSMCISNYGNILYKESNYLEAIAYYQKAVEKYFQF